MRIDLGPLLPDEECQAHEPEVGNSPDTVGAHSGRNTRIWEAMRRLTTIWDIAASATPSDSAAVVRTLSTAALSFSRSTGPPSPFILDDKPQ